MVQPHRDAKRVRSPPRQATQALETVLESQLQRSWAMRVHRVQESAPSQTIGASGKISSSGVVRPTIATNSIASGITQIRVINAELSVVENVEGFRPELDLATFADHKMLQ